MKDLSCLLLAVGVTVSGNALAQAPRFKLPPGDWRNVRFEGDNSRFAARRKAVERLAREDLLPTSPLLPMPSSTKDLPLAFGHALTVYLVDLSEHRKMLRPGAIAYAHGLAIEVAARSKAYDACRLAYLMSARQGPSGLLIPLGRRLLAKNPNDWPVVFEQLPNFDLSGKERLEALRLSKRLKAARPNHPATLMRTGYVNYHVFLHNRQRPYLVLARMDYLKAKTLATSEEDRKYADRMLDNISFEERRKRPTSLKGS